MRGRGANIGWIVIETDIVNPITSFAYAKCTQDFAKIPKASPNHSIMLEIQDLMATLGP